LFSAERAKTPIKALSGGECNRVILARLFTRPSNLLVLDEPTNDLDVETLDVLEARLSEYSGTLIVVSHDRAFMDNVVTSVLVFEDSGKIEHYPGGYSDWLARGKKLAETDNPNRGKPRVETPAAAPAVAPKAPSPPPATPGKLSYKFKLELEQLPAKIEALEAAVSALSDETNAPGFYQRPLPDTQRTLASLAAQQEQLDGLYTRWAELEALQSGAS